MTARVAAFAGSFRKEYQAGRHHKPKSVAKVAAARKLAVRLYRMMRQNVGYPVIALGECNRGCL